MRIVERSHLGTLVEDPIMSVTKLDVPAQPTLLPGESTASLRPARDVLSRLRWDEECDLSDFVVVYTDRFMGQQEKPASQWKTEPTDDEFISQHRIVAFKNRRTGHVVWDRAQKIDRIFGSGNSGRGSLEDVS